MSYKKLKNQRNDIRTKLNEAKTELAELEEKRDDLFQSLEKAEEKRINERAKVKVGKGSKKESDTAGKEYKKLKNQIDSIRDDIQVQEKAITMLEQEKAEIQSYFQREARKKWRSISDKHLSNIAALMEDIAAEIDTLHDYQQELQKDGFHNPSRQFFKGINRHSKPLISKGRLGAESQNFIKTNNLKSD